MKKFFWIIFIISVHVPFVAHSKRCRIVFGEGVQKELFPIKDGPRIGFEKSPQKATSSALTAGAEELALIVTRKRRAIAVLKGRKDLGAVKELEQEIRNLILVFELKSRPWNAKKHEGLTERLRALRQEINQLESENSRLDEKYDRYDNVGSVEPANRVLKQINGNEQRIVKLKEQERLLKRELSAFEKEVLERNQLWDGE